VTIRVALHAAALVALADERVHIARLLVRSTLLASSFSNGRDCSRSPLD
jgi:hypothetical protein